MLNARLATLCSQLPFHFPFSIFHSASEAVGV